MTRQTHVIFGTGPVGCWIARTLVDQDLPVRAINRSGSRPGLMPEAVEMVAADAADAAQAIAAAKGAAVVYQALNPPYHQWHRFFPALQVGALAAASETGARYVSIDNLYMYDSANPITEDAPVRPRSKKGELRTNMAAEVLAAHKRGDTEATVLRSSDYYGPGVTGSALGEMVFGNLVQGKKVQLGGSASTPHSFAYIEDVGRAAAILGSDDRAPGQVWIAPHAGARTQGEMVELAARVLGREPKMTEISPLMMRLAGLFIPEARAMVEMMYEFTEPFVVDSSRFQQTFGLEPTPVEVGIERTVRWYQNHAGQK
jgi:nucleoside-diphosphate-sugar epimerase